VNAKPDDLTARVAELETRIAFQEHTSAELSDALADVRNEAARNTGMLVRALGDLKLLRTMLHDDPGSEPPPPHY
jgi:SlyX protein